MLLKSKGGFAAFEAIAALACILFLCSIIIPAAATMTLKVEEANKRAASWVVLYEQLQRIKVTGQVQQKIVKEGTTYQISWEKGERICVSYEIRPSAIAQTCLQNE
ncbi:hypothetical protein [Jeotgalibacillus proteolyticus]|uniref:Type II secretion system protein n=1 Tax=Jeotgalibacillus proteolyticus TaxID=2082395 RepID=A0A2S5GEM5_9BACL|nr:hypothetical protein [Jeotgalibacillus proteolyticus]PPA71398.1 hypothetical protein C4B60_04860 [Jeotgalibacillus proteolyticus]